MQNEHALNGNFSLLTKLAEHSQDCIEHIGTALLECGGVYCTLCVGTIPAVESPESWGTFKLKCFYANGFAYVIDPLESRLLKLNSDDSDLVSPETDVTARPLPVHCTDVRVGPTYSRASLLKAIDKEGAQFVVNSSGQLLVNFTDSTLDEANSDTNSYVLSHTTDAKRMTKAWISELVILPDAKLVPYAAKEERMVFGIIPLSKSVTLFGRPRVYARIPIATRMPKINSIWYAMLPCNLQAPSVNMQKSARDEAKRERRHDKIFEPRLSNLISATIWHYLFSPHEATCGQNEFKQAFTGYGTLQRFLCPMNAQKRDLMCIDNAKTFAETSAGERLKLASKSRSLESLSETQRRIQEEADALLDL